MKKGITPIIAVIILLLITVALAGMAWVFMSGYFTGMTAKNIQLVDSYCVSGTANVIIRNAGTSTIALTPPACNTANTITGSVSYVCGELTIVKTAPSGQNLNNGELSAATVATGLTITFSEDCGAGNTCTYRFTTTTGAAGPSPNVATVNC